MDGEDDMQPAVKRRLTYDDFLLFPEGDGLRHEIIDGEHYVTPAPNLSHQDLVGRLYFALELWLRAHPGTGRVLFAPFDVVLSYHDVVEPDLMFVAADQPHILTQKNVQGPPALVIEVLSPGTRKRDRTIKRDLFERSGVREYWLVDPDAKTVTVLRRGGSCGFDAPFELSHANGDGLTTPLLLGFSLPLAELFESR